MVCKRQVRTSKPPHRPTQKTSPKIIQTTYPIPLLAGTGSEGTENFQVVVNTASGATVIDGTGVVTIRDDD